MVFLQLMLANVEKGRFTHKFRQRLPLKMFAKKEKMCLQTE